MSQRARARHRHAAIAVIAVLMLPIFVTGRIWGLDWTVHLWMNWIQGAHISAGGPSFFTHTAKLGAFYPQFAFYGGTAYTVGGAISAVLGGKALVAYTVMIAAAFASAYGGMLWLGLQAGLRGWRLHAAPLLLVTSQYWLTNAYSRGAYSELLATSALPLMLAAAVSLLRGPRLRLGPVAALLAGSVIWSGTHNITLVVGGMFLAAIALIGVWALPRHGLELDRRAVAAVLGITALGIAINAWFLWPAVRYSATTNVGAQPDPMLWFMSDWFSRSGIIFSPVPRMAKEWETPGLFTNLPVLLMAWTGVGALLVARRAERPVRRALGGLAVLVTALTILLVAHWPWPHLPRALHFVQFTYRLETYIIVGTGLMLILVLRAAPRERRMRRAAPRVLAALLCVAGGFAIWQTWMTGDMYGTSRQDTFSRGVYEVPPTWYDGGSFRDVSAPMIDVAPDRWVHLPLDQIKDDRFEGDVPMPAGDQPIATNIGGGPDFVHVTGVGIRVFGRTNDGYVVVQRLDPAAPAGTVHMRVVPIRAGAIAAGRLTTFAALLLSVLLLGWLAVRGAWSRLRWPVPS